MIWLLALGYVVAGLVTGVGLLAYDSYSASLEGRSRSFEGDEPAYAVAGAMWPLFIAAVSCYFAWNLTAKKLVEYARVKGIEHRNRKLELLEASRDLELP
jgi:hypothetical protein